ncbi:MAG: excinuclease ABC subunit C [Pasteurellales bacterium]|nr:MAG: excinuclease ABC subunit C [Pasteurellales bacterium]
MNNQNLFDHKVFLKTVSSQSGVYLMFDANKKLIYVGKAKNLKNRLSSYFQKDVQSIKTKSLVSQIAHIQTLITHSEIEALLLEQNYIKQNRPKYNILLRDDKSYPYLLLSKHKHPRISYFRGVKNAKGEYFGPYPNANAVKMSLDLLQKMFPIRQCSDNFYNHRSRPCLQYQIGRCLAPCVEGYVTDEEYQSQVDLVRLFLKGDDQKIQAHLIEKMNDAAENLEFEKAGEIRDQIAKVQSLSKNQAVDKNKNYDLDVVSISFINGIALVLVLFVRGGKILGHQSYKPKVPKNSNIDEITTAFMSQFYLQKNDRNVPNEILCDQPLKEQDLLSQALSQKQGRAVKITTDIKGEKKHFIELAQTNLQNEFRLQLSKKLQNHHRFKALEELLNIKKIERMECFDISHTMGEQTVASCVVFDDQGPLFSDYRIFNIEGITKGDDYAAMEQALLKRYNRDLECDKIPDILFIDGGIGQLNRAVEVFNSLKVNWNKDKPLLIGVAKGSERKVGLETLIVHQWGNQAFNLEPHNEALHLIQYIRDESHRYAITRHRKKRGKAFTSSILEQIDGIGTKRRQAILSYLGGMNEVKNATIDDLVKVPNISKQLATKIYHHLQAIKK